MTRVLAGIVVVLALSVLTPITPQAASTQPESRQPDSTGLLDPLPPTMSATVDVNVIFIGFEQKTYYDNPEAPNDYQAIYTDVLPLFYSQKSDPIIRIESQPGAPILADHHLDYRYHTHYTSSAFDDRFFAHLEGVGRLASRTPWQTLYNAQQSNILEVPEQILRVRGADVEHWLLRELRRLPDIDPNSYTMVFINWYSRPDFQFHVYEGEKEDPDTGFSSRTDNYGPGIAWGGTHGRLWFYDFSAGPDGPTMNWNVDDAEVVQRYLFYDGPDGYLDYRIPPIWEMRDGLPPWIAYDATLAAGVIAQTAMHFLFTPSPIYDPLASVPDPGGKRVLRLNYFDGDPQVPSQDVLKPRRLEAHLQALQPYIPLKVSLTERPVGADDVTMIRTLFWSFLNLAFAPGCWEPFGHPFWSFYCYVNEREGELAQPTTPNDWVIPAALYNVTDAFESENPVWLFGVAVWDPESKPYAVFVESFPFIRNHPIVSEGMTTTLAHEVGHHVGLAHEHDGWQGDGGFSIGAFNSKWVWAFNECQCVMGYLNVATGFGQFEQDNVARNLAARAYAETVRLLASDDGRGRSAVDAHLRLANKNFQQMDWRSSVKHALQAYEKATKFAGRRMAPRMSLTTDAAYPGPHPGLIDPPSLDPEQQPELHQLRRARSLRHADPLMTNERLLTMPGVIQSANDHPLLRRYLESTLSKKQ